MTDQPTPVTCHAVRCYPDMYPEFADGPIVVDCRENAMFFWNHRAYGPVGSYFDRSLLCPEHCLEDLAAWVQDEGQGPLTVRSLDANDLRNYHHGYAQAMGVTPTHRQLELAAHLDLDEAGLGSPEGSDELFDCGWAYFLGQEVGAWITNVELSDEP